MQSQIKTLMSTMAIDQVREIQVSEAVDDGAGGYIRSLKFFGKPSPDSAENLLLLDLRVSSETKRDIDITAPEQTF